MTEAKFVRCKNLILRLTFLQLVLVLAIYTIWNFSDALLQWASRLPCLRPSAKGKQPGEGVSYGWHCIEARCLVQGLLVLAHEAICTLTQLSCVLACCSPGAVLGDHHISGIKDPA
jgi:hypothetical protein